MSRRRHGGSGRKKLREFKQRMRHLDEEQSARSRKVLRQAARAREMAMPD